MMPRQQPDGYARTQLHALAAEIEMISDFRVETFSAEPPGTAYLQVTIPQGAGLTESVHCAAGAEAWWFTWSWGDRIGLATDVEGTARAIRHVLLVRSDLLTTTATGALHDRRTVRGLT